MSHSLASPASSVAATLAAVLGQPARPETRPAYRRVEAPVGPMTIKHLKPACEDDDLAKPLSPDLIGPSMCEYPPQYVCPTCESAVPGECIAHGYHDPATQRSRTSLIACPHCDAIHKADFVRSVGTTWQQVSNIIRVPNLAAELNDNDRRGLEDRVQHFAQQAA